MRIRPRFFVGVGLIAVAIGYLIFNAIRTTSEYYLTVNEVAARQAERPDNPLPPAKFRALLLEKMEQLGIDLGEALLPLLDEPAGSALLQRIGTLRRALAAQVRHDAEERSLVAASRHIGISRDRAVYRVERLERAFGAPVVRSVRGGSGHGRTRLTALGDRIVRGGFDSVELLDARPVTPLSAPNLLHGVYRAGPSPEVQVARSLRLRVAFPADDGEAVSVLLDPEAVLVARKRFDSSARNVVEGRVESIRVEPGQLGITLVVRCGGTRLRVAMTNEPVRALGLRPGAAVFLYVKATALRRVGERPSDRPRRAPLEHRNP
jgi:molybdate transport system regulatory protein